MNDEADLVLASRMREWGDTLHSDVFEPVRRNVFLDLGRGCRGSSRLDGIRGGALTPSRGLARR